MYVRQQTYDRTTQEMTNYTTNDASFVEVETNYDFWSASRYVNPFVELLQQLQVQYRVCMQSGLEKYRILADLLQSTHLTSHVV